LQSIVIIASTSTVLSRCIGLSIYLGDRKESACCFRGWTDHGYV